MYFTMGDIPSNSSEWPGSVVRESDCTNFRLLICFLIAPQCPSPTCGQTEGSRHCQLPFLFSRQFRSVKRCGRIINRVDGASAVGYSKMSVCLVLLSIMHSCEQSWDGYSSSLLNEDWLGLSGLRGYFQGDWSHGNTNVHSYFVRANADNSDMGQFE